MRVNEPAQPGAGLYLGCASTKGECSGTSGTLCMVGHSQHAAHSFWHLICSPASCCLTWRAAGHKDQAACSWDLSHTLAMLVLVAPGSGAGAAAAAVSHSSSSGCSPSLALSLAANLACACSCRAWPLSTDRAGGRAAGLVGPLSAAANSFVDARLPSDHPAGHRLRCNTVCSLHAMVADACHPS